MTGKPRVGKQVPDFLSHWPVLHQVRAAMGLLKPRVQVGFFGSMCYNNKNWSINLKLSSRTCYVHFFTPVHSLHLFI